MSTGMFMLLFNSPFKKESTVPECDELKRDMIALELFLQDKSDKKEFCPKLDWEQPDISVYKEELKSQLPEGCKK
tara:strand:+ start:5597 stop:5821 length:225 start_codon:yes stop_codon:yes gene_type:complete